MLMVCMTMTMFPIMGNSIGGLQGGKVYAASAVTLSGDQRSDIIKIAKNCQGMKLPATKKQLKKYGKSLWKGTYEGDWCAWFISNCAVEAGVKKSVFPHSTIAGTSTFGKYKAKGNYTPKPGDVALFGKPGATYHVELVYSVSNGKVKTIGGNTGSQSWSKAVVSKPQVKSGIYGYVPIKYPAPAKASHTFSYSLNGGSGSFGSVTLKDGEKLTIPSTKPTKAGYDFLGYYVRRNADATWHVNGSGWLTEPNLNGKARALYQPGSSYIIDNSWTKGSPKSSYTFWAQWKIRPEFKLKFNPNGGTGTMPQQTIKLTGGIIAFDSVNQFKKDGSVMEGWTVQRIALDGSVYWIVPNGSSWTWKKNAAAGERKLYKDANRFSFGTNGISAGDTIVLWASWAPAPVQAQVVDEPEEEPIVDEPEEEPIVDEPEEEPIIDEFEDEPIIDEPEEEPVIDEPEEEPIVEEPVYVWSDWSEYTSTPVSASDTCEVQTIKQYRYRDKQTTTSGEAALSGWTKYDTKTSVSTSGYKFGTPIATSTSMANNRKTVTSAVDKGYYYYAYVVANPSNTSDWCYYADKTRAKVISHMKANFSNSTAWAEKRLRYFWYVSPTDLGATSAKLKKTIPYCADSTVSVGTFSQKATHYYDIPMFRYNQCYKVKTTTTTNYFYKWGNWSSWSETAYSGSDTRQVETQTLYRYRTLVAE